MAIHNIQTSPLAVAYILQMCGFLEVMNYSTAFSIGLVKNSFQCLTFAWYGCGIHLVTEKYIPCYISVHMSKFMQCFNIRLLYKFRNKKVKLFF